VIEFAGAAPPADEIAAILAALASIEGEVQVPVSAKTSPWKLAARNYEPQDDERCSARF